MGAGGTKKGERPKDISLRAIYKFPTTTNTLRCGADRKIQHVDIDLQGLFTAYDVARLHNYLRKVMDWMENGKDYTFRRAKKFNSSDV